MGCLERFNMRMHDITKTKRRVVRSWSGIEAANAASEMRDEEDLRKVVNMNISSKFVATRCARALSRLGVLYSDTDITDMSSGSLSREGC